MPKIYFGIAELVARFLRSSRQLVIGSSTASTALVRGIVMSALGPGDLLGPPSPSLWADGRISRPL